MFQVSEPGLGGFIVGRALTLVGMIGQDQEKASSNFDLFLYAAVGIILLMICFKCERADRYRGRKRDSVSAP